MGKALEAVRGMIRDAEEEHQGLKVQEIDLEPELYDAVLAECAPRLPADVLGIPVRRQPVNIEPPERGTLH